MIADLVFWKSSYSAKDQNCIEVSHTPVSFRTSSYSAQDQNCVEVGDLPCGAALRDSKNPEHGHFTFPAAEWNVFLTEVKSAAL